MNTQAVVNEFAKMKHLRVGVIGVALVVAVTGMSLFSAVVNPDFDPDSTSAWNALLAGMSLGVPLASPLLLAVLVSRHVDIEHTGNGWLLQATAGITPGSLCRAKFTALGIVVLAITLAQNLLVFLTGKLLAGITAPLPTAHWAGFAVCILAVNLVVLALHVVISATVENQLVALGVGVLGTLPAVLSQGLPVAMAHLTPWGYYALARAADYQGEAIVPLPLSYPSIAALVVVAAALFWIITDRFDRQEA